MVSEDSCLFLLQFLQTFHLLGFEELVDAAQMLAHAAVAELIHLRHETVEEVAVVAYHDERAVEVL